MLDEQPVGAFTAAALAIPFHADEHPAARQAFTGQGELEVAALQPVMRIALGNPIAAIPELHRSAAILALGNGAFEVAVIERMVLDLDRQPLDLGVERRALRDSPRLEHAIELEPEIVMQPRRIMTLNDEPKLRR